MRKEIAIDDKKYSFFANYTFPVKDATRTIEGREQEMSSIMSAMCRPELCNVALLGPAGSGKSSILQKCKMDDENRYYFEVDLSKMINELSNPDELAHKIKALFGDVEQFCKEYDCQVVLFIDEFHLIVQLSAAAVEVLKPMLADSGIRGIRVIVATTYEEWEMHISSNLPLVERFQTIRLAPTDNVVTKKILKKMAERYGVEEKVNDSIYNLIIEYTNRYRPASVQPRKSITMFDAMIGRHLYSDEKIDKDMLTKLLYEIDGVNVGFNVDATKIEENLNKAVYSQQFVMKMIAGRLQMNVANFHNKDKPLASFLFLGSTGVGKALPDSTPVPVPTGIKLHGELQVGDEVFTEDGKKQMVIATHPQGKCQVYNLKLVDSRELPCNKEHLWNVYTVRDGYMLCKTEDIMKLLNNGIKVYLPQSSQVEYDKIDGLECWEENPYDFGRRIASRSHIDGAYIPDKYLFLSVEERLDLVRGLFDERGNISTTNYELYFEHKNFEFIKRVRYLLFSLGISNHLLELNSGRNRIIVQVEREFRGVFFKKSDKKKRAEKGVYFGKLSGSNKDYSMVEIKSVEKTNRKESMQCIEVSGESQLYLAGDFVVTHNTETCKALAKLLFDNPKALIRVDMTEYASANSIERFRSYVTSRIKENPFSILLLDEVEKAHEEVIRLLLPLLDDGRMTDNNNREVSFLNTYVILTSNAGAEIYKDIGAYNENDTGDGENFDIYKKLILDSLTRGGESGGQFPPELLGRINTFVAFQPLSRETREKICKAKLQDLVKKCKEIHNVRLNITAGKGKNNEGSVVKFIVDDRTDNNTNAGGARQIVNIIESELTQKVAAYINANPTHKLLVVTVEGNLKSENKNMLKSSAKLVVKRG